jgi:hypothetical protein
MLHVQSTTARASDCLIVVTLRPTAEFHRRLLLLLLLLSTAARENYKLFNDTLSVTLDDEVKAAFENTMSQ